MDNPNTTTIEDNLSPQQESFCRYYTQNDSTFGIGVDSYAVAYGYDLETAPKDDGVYEYIDGVERVARDVNEFDMGEEEYKRVSTMTKRLVKLSSYDSQYGTCKVNASRLLTKANIQATIRKYLLEQMNDEVVDSVLTSIITNPREQSKDRIAALKEYNALKARIIKKLDLSSLGEKIDTTNPTLLALAKEYEDKLKESLQGGDHK